MGILLADGVYNTEFVAPLDVFQHAAARLGNGTRVVLIAPRKEPVVTAEGMRVLPDHSFADAPPVDILVVPSFEEFRDRLRDRELVEWVARAGRRAQVVISNCWGAFFLAEAGLLDGREATTFPPDVLELGRRYPGVTAVEGVRFVVHGAVITGVGGVGSYETALYEVERRWGGDLARSIAAGLVIEEWDPESIRHRRVPIPDN